MAARRQIVLAVEPFVARISELTILWCLWRWNRSVPLWPLLPWEGSSVMDAMLERPVL